MKTDIFFKLPSGIMRMAATIYAAFFAFAYGGTAHAFTMPQARDLGGIIKFVGNLATWLGAIAGAIFVLLFIAKGIKLAMASGNPRDKADAIDGLMWTGIGAVVAFAAVYLVGVAMGIGQNIEAPLM